MKADAIYLLTDGAPTDAKGRIEDPERTLEAAREWNALRRVAIHTIGIGAEHNSAFLRQLGADVVGMSLVPENLVAVHGGMRVLAFSVITDMCLPDRLEPASIPKILAVAGRAAPLLDRLVTEVVRRLDEAGSASRP